MDKKTSPGGVGAIGGKGFYIVLLLCAAVIGVSAWILLTDAGTNVEETAENKEIPSIGVVETAEDEDTETNIGEESPLEPVDFDATKMHYLRSDDPNFKPHQAEVMVKTFIPLKYIENI